MTDLYMLFQVTVVMNYPNKSAKYSVGNSYIYVRDEYLSHG